MAKTFSSSYLTERLKMGDAATARKVRQALGLEVLEPFDAGLVLSFAEDRALTAVQQVFAFGGFKAQEHAPLSPQAQLQWGCAELPVLVSDVRSYCRTYAQGADVAPAMALGALKSLCAKRFYLGYSDAPDAPLRCLHGPVLAVQKYKLTGVRAPTHLRFALTPVLLQGVYPECTGFRFKPTDLHARIVSSTAPGAGRPPEQLLRLCAWLLALPKRPTVRVGDRTLAERLRSRALQHSHVSKFREVVCGYFEVAKQLGLLKEAQPPSEATEGKWLVKLK